MGFLKVIKDKSYYKRYQVKYRRRRQCKTDYQARQKLITQDKNKYQTPKYRFVVRISNKDIICQVFSSDLQKDTCLAAAYSHELKRYGITVGLTNYAAAYTTGLLLARRINKKYGLDYEGCTEVTGEEYHVEGDGHGKAPFKALLDVGLAHTTTGARIFGAVKGACDGGLNVPHSTRRFPGSSKAEDSKEVSFDADIHRKHIFGIHVADYMRLLKSEDPEKYKVQFSKYIAAGIEADDVEKMYTDAHAAIRANPTIPRDKLERGNNKTRKAAKGKEYPKKRFSTAPASVEQRKNRIKQKLTAMGKQTLPHYTLTEKAYP